MPRYVVRIADNFHYMNEAEHYTHATFATAVEAIAECRRLVDRELDHLLAQGVPPEKLLQYWITFGDDPFVPGVTWSAADHARKRALAIQAPIAPRRVAQAPRAPETPPATPDEPAPRS
jgi:hypothetical protein